MRIGHRQCAAILKLLLLKGYGWFEGRLWLAFAITILVEYELLRREDVLGQALLVALLLCGICRQQAKKKTTTNLRIFNKQLMSLL